MARLRRRDLLKAAFAAAALGGARLGCYRIARPSDPDGPMSDAAQAFLDRCWDGIDPTRTLDCHVHVVGLGVGNTGAHVNPHMHSLLHPIDYARFSIYVTAAGVTDLDQADQQYVARLVSLVRAQKKHGRLLLLAFDRAYREDGTPDEEASEFYTPNDYVLRLAKEYPDCFVAAGSVHPYRKDAVDELSRVAEAGAEAIKWLPNAMRIDPSSPRCDAYYAKLAELGMPLLTHAGEEKAVNADEWQRMGNPLHLRRALDAGVKVIVAHCASLGENPDLDAAGAEKPWADNFALFLRLMQQKQYEGRVFGDVSALIQYNRCEYIAKVLEADVLRGRLINGTDYPLPAINALIRTGKLESLGYITSEERALLNEIDRYNPLAFDFALKRTVKVARAGREVRFPAEAFTIREGLFRRLS